MPDNYQPPQTEEEDVDRAASQPEAESNVVGASVVSPWRIPPAENLPAGGEGELCADTSPCAQLTESLRPLKEGVSYLHEKKVSLVAVAFPWAFSFKNFWRRFSARRFLAQARAEVPLASFLIGLSIGQAAAWLGYLGPEKFVWLVSALLLALLVFLRTRSPGLLVGCAVGWILFSSMLPRFTPTSFGKDPIIFTARVVSTPRYGRVGAITAQLQPQGREVFKRTSNGLESQPSTVDLLHCRGIDVPWRNTSKLEQGSLVVVTAKITPLVPTLSPFSYDASLIRTGVTARCVILWATVAEPASPPWLITIRNSVREQVEQVVGDGERAGLTLSLALGFRDVLSPTTEDLFRRLGLSHLLVVSGYQVSLVFGLAHAVVYLICILVGIPRPHVVAALCGLFVAVSFGWFVVLEKPVFRALISAALVAGATIYERGRISLHGICLALIAVMLIWPGSLFDPGVQLTFAAILGMSLASEALLANRSKQSFPTRMLEGAKVMWWASAFTTIIAAFWFGIPSWIGFLIGPLVAVSLTVIGCLGGLLGISLVACGGPEFGWLLEAATWICEWCISGLRLLSPESSHPAVQAAFLFCCGVALVVKVTSQVVAFSRLRAR